MYTTSLFMHKRLKPPIRMVKVMHTYFSHGLLARGFYSGSFAPSLVVRFVLQKSEEFGCDHADTNHVIFKRLKDKSVPWQADRMSNKYQSNRLKKSRPAFPIRSGFQSKHVLPSSHKCFYRLTLGFPRHQFTVSFHCPGFL